MGRVTRAVGPLVPSTNRKTPYGLRMGHASVDADDFDAFEAAGWEEKADAYERMFCDIASRVVDPLLNAAAVGVGTRVLDVATGPGWVAARAAERGASVVGIDVAEAMIARARSAHPDLDFRRADAHDLPFADASFDAVVSNFAIMHFSHPDRAMAEFARGASSRRQAGAHGVGCLFRAPAGRSVPRCAGGGARRAACGSPPRPRLLPVLR